MCLIKAKALRVNSALVNQSLRPVQCAVLAGFTSSPPLAIRSRRSAFMSASVN